MALYVYYTGYLYFAIADKVNTNNYKTTSTGFVSLFTWYYVAMTVNY